MEISIVRLAVLAVIGILAALLCRSRNTEFGILISIAICLLIIGFILKGFEQLADFFETADRKPESDIYRSSVKADRDCLRV